MSAGGVSRLQAGCVLLLLVACALAAASSSRAAHRRRSPPPAIVTVTDVSPDAACCAVDTTNSDPGGQMDGMAADPLNPNVAYVSGEQSGVWRTTDGGASWTHASTGLETGETNGGGPTMAEPALAVDPVSRGRLLYAAADDDLAPGYPSTGFGHTAGLYASIDAARHWSRVTLPGCPAPSVTGVAFAGGAAYGCHRVRSRGLDRRDAQTVGDHAPGRQRGPGRGHLGDRRPGQERVGVRLRRRERVPLGRRGRVVDVDSRSGSIGLLEPRDGAEYDLAVRHGRSDAGGQLPRSVRRQPERGGERASCPPAARQGRGWGPEPERAPTSTPPRSQATHRARGRGPATRSCVKWRSLYALEARPGNVGPDRCRRTTTSMGLLAAPADHPDHDRHHLHR